MKGSTRIRVRKRRGDADRDSEAVMIIGALLTVAVFPATSASVMVAVSEPVVSTPTRVSTSIRVSTSTRMSNGCGIQRCRQKHRDGWWRHHRKFAATSKEFSTVVVKRGSGINRWFVSAEGHFLPLLKIFNFHAIN
jgi:hypothetical protein